MHDHQKIVSTWRKFSCLSACKKLTSSLTSFLRYLKNHSIDLKKPLMFICRQKINFILHIFPEILRGYCKFAILGTLGMPSYAHPKWYYQVVENVCVYLRAKNQIHLPCFSGDTQNIYKFLNLCTLGMFDYAYSKW